MSRVDELKQRLAVTLDKLGIPKEPIEEWDFESKQPTLWQLNQDTNKYMSVKDMPKNPNDMTFALSKAGIKPTRGTGTADDPYIYSDEMTEEQVNSTGSVRDRIDELLDEHDEVTGAPTPNRVNQIPINSSDSSAFKSPIDAQNPGKHIADIKLDKGYTQKIKNPKYPINISKLKQRLAAVNSLNESQRFQRQSTDARTQGKQIKNKHKRKIGDITKREDYGFIRTPSGTETQKLPRGLSGGSKNNAVRQRRGQ